MPVFPPLTDPLALLPGQSFVTVTVTVTVSGLAARASSIGDPGGAGMLMWSLFGTARGSRTFSGMVSRFLVEGGAFGALGPKLSRAWARPTTQAFLEASEAMA